MFLEINWWVFAASYGAAAALTVLLAYVVAVTGQRAGRSAGRHRPLPVPPVGPAGSRPAPAPVDDRRTPLHVG